MYAEYFGVRPWLEPAGKWLRWAMQSTTARKLGDARYNLQQFWKALESFKAKASTSRDWAEVLLLDSQSQWALAGLCQAEQSAEMMDMANYSALKKTIQGLNPVAWVEWVAQKAFDIQDPTLAALAKKVQTLGDQAEQANQNAQALAAQAKQAEAQARTQDASLPKSNVDAVLKVTGYTAPMLKDVNRSAGKTTGNMIKQDQAGPSFPSFSNPFTFSLWGLPVWAWGAIGLGAVLLLTPSAPSISLSTGRRP